MKPPEEPSQGVVTEAFEIVNELGLHARAAARLVKTAAQFDADVTLSKDGQYVNAKSIMGVLLLCGQKGTRVTVTADGPDAVAVVRAIGQLIADRFGEAQ
jgi:phosphocarrier protein